VEKRPRRGCPDSCGPARRGRRLVVEVADGQLAEDDQIVVADETGLGARLYRLATVVRPRSVADGVAEAPECIDLRAVDLSEHGLERVIVSVDIGDDCDARRQTRDLSRRSEERRVGKEWRSRGRP